MLLWVPLLREPEDSDRSACTGALPLTIIKENWSVSVVSWEKLLISSLKSEYPSSNSFLFRDPHDSLLCQEVLCSHVVL